LPSGKGEERRWGVIIGQKKRNTKNAEKHRQKIVKRGGKKTDKKDDPLLVAISLQEKKRFNAPEILGNKGRVVKVKGPALETLVKE